MIFPSGGGGSAILSGNNGGGSGGSNAPVLIVEGVLQVIDTSSIHTVSQVAPITSLYQVSVWMESYGTGAAGSTVIGTLAWTSPVEVHSETLTMVLDSSAIEVETFPILVVAGATNSFTTAFGTTAAPYDITVRIVKMPLNV